VRDQDVPLGEVLAAVAAFGHDAAARLRFLQRFVEWDLNSQDAMKQAVLEVLVFTFAARVAGPAGRAGSRMAELDAAVGDPKAFREVWSTVVEAQRTVGQLLASFKTGGACRCPLEIVGWERLSDGRVLPLVGGDWWHRFYGAVCMFLVEAGPDLRVCANATCQRLFLRAKRQEYCERRCSQRERTQRFRAKRPGRVSDLRHQSYERRQRRAPGKRNVKVRRLAPRRRDQTRGRQDGA
jgi:hypothetical protein